MEKQNEGAQDVVVEQEEQTTEETLPETTPEETPEEDNFVKIPKDRFKSMQRKAMAYDATKRGPSKPLPTQNDSLDEDVVKSVKKLELIEQKRQYGYEQNLSPEETDFIFKFSGGKPTKETLENPFVKSGLEGFRASKRLAANTPSSSTSSKVFQGKEFKDMNEDERRKAFTEAGKKFKA